MKTAQMVEIIIAALQARGYSAGEAATLVKAVRGQEGLPAALVQLQDDYRRCVALKEVALKNPYMPPPPIEAALLAIRQYLQACGV